MPIRFFETSGRYRALFLCIFVLTLPIPGENEINLNSHDLSVMDSRLHEEIEASGILLKDSMLSQYIERIISKLIGDNGAKVVERIQIKFLSSSMVNAFSLSDGSIYISLAVLGLIDNDAQLAFLLAHELAHIDLKHHMELKYELHEQTLKATQSKIAGSIFGINIPGSHYVRKALSGFSISNEFEADSVALHILHLKGYNTWQAKEIFSNMYRWLKYQEKSVNEKYATHPKFHKRLKACKRQLLNLKVDTTQGIIGADSYRAVLHPHSIKIAESLLASNGAYELYSMASRKIELYPDSPVWEYLKGKILKAYWPIDSFSVSSNAFKKAYNSKPAFLSALREMGWLYMKNGQYDSASIFLKEYIERDSDSENALLIKYYLGIE